MSAQVETPQQDARTSARRRMLTAAKIIFNNKQSVFDCTVRNISEDGARLIVPNMLGVPKSFELRIPKIDARYICDTVWRTKRETGIKFSAKISG